MNDVLRAGLSQTLRPRRTRRRYRTPSTDTGQCLIGSIADVEQVLSDVEEAERR